MRILGINTAIPQSEIALLDENSVLYSDAWESNYNEAEKLLPAVKKVVNKAKAELPVKADTLTEGAFLDKIFIVAGPGSFTGLRIGVTIANTLAFVYQVPIISCTTFEYFEHKIPANLLQETAIMLRAGGQKIAIWLPADKKVNIMSKNEIVEFLQDKSGTDKKTSQIKNVATDIKKNTQEDYTLPKGVSWLQITEMKDFAEVIKEVAAQNPPEHKLVKPQYLAPPSITKSKKEVYV